MLAFSGLLAGTYFVDLTIPRSPLSTIHYCGPALILALVRNLASSGTSADALMCRMIMSLVFFGASFGGIATTGLTFAFHCRRIWSKSATPKLLVHGYMLYACMLPVLTMAVVTGHCYIAAFLHYWLDESYARYGLGLCVLLGVAFLDLLLEARFLHWFHSYERRYRAIAHGTSMQPEDMPRNPRSLISWLPSWQATVLGMLFSIWLVVMLSLFWRILSIHSSLNARTSISWLSIKATF